MKKIIFLCLIEVITLAAGANIAWAQTETEKGVSVDTDIELMRRDLRNEKKKLIAVNVPLTADEATKFWPVYDEYTMAMAKVNDEFYKVIKDYALNQKTLTDAQAISMIKRWSEIQVQQAQTRQKYIPAIEKVIPGKKAALFFQVDRRLYALMDLQTAAQVPLVLQ
jgi:hypothetical protein